MPMIDVYARAGTFADKPALISALCAAIMKWEQVPPISLFSDNTAAFVHELPADALGNANGATNYVRVGVLTPTGILDRAKKLGVTAEITQIIADAAGDQGLKERTWVLIEEAPDGGWGVAGHANTNAEIAAEAKRRLGL